jgi:hypothetical protein
MRRQINYGRKDKDRLPEINIHCLAVTPTAAIRQQGAHMGQHSRLTSCGEGKQLMEGAAYEERGSSHP